jgi:signal peptidase I
MNMAGKTSIRKANKKGVVREYAEAFIIAFIIALLIRTFLVQAFKIPSSSMEPTLLVGDHILVSKFIYGLRIPYIGKKFLTFHKPNRGDVVVFVYPEDPKKDFIKRVIATGGEEVQIKNRKIFINGTAPSSRAISGRRTIMDLQLCPPTPFLSLETTEIIAKTVGIGGSSIYRQ